MPDSSPVAAADEDAAALAEVAAPAAERTDDGWSLIAMVPYDGKDRRPPCRRSWPWPSGAPSRPSGIRRCWPVRGSCPGSSPIESPTPPGPREVRIIAGDQGDRLPSGLPDPGRGCRCRPARLGDRPRRADPPHPGADGGRRRGRRRRDRDDGGDVGRFPGARDRAMDAPRPDRRDGALRGRRPREPLARADGRGACLAARRLARRRPIASAPGSRCSPRPASGSTPSTPICSTSACWIRRCRPACSPSPWPRRFP